MQRGADLRSFNPGEMRDSDVLKAAASEIYAMRRARDRYLPRDLVSEPAWDMLLQLYLSHPEFLVATVLSAGADLPASTGRRWISALEHAALIRTAGGATLDTSVSLTALGHRTMEACLAAMLCSEVSHTEQDTVSS